MLNKETTVDTLAIVGSGFVLAWLMNHYVLPHWGFVATVGNTTTVTAIFTVVALVRVYIVRAWLKRWRRR